MIPPNHTNLDCIDARGNRYVGRYSSLAKIHGLPVSNTEGLNKLRWFRGKENGWVATMQPASWAIPHGTNPTMITDEIRRADQL